MNIYNFPLFLPIRDRTDGVSRASSSTMNSPVIWSISKFPGLPFYCVDNLWVFCWFLYEISQFLEPWMTYKLTVETSSTGCQLPFLIKRIQQFFIPLNLFIDLEGLRLLDQPLVRCMRMF